MHAANHDHADNGADDHGVFQGFGVLEAHAAHRGLRQADGADTNQHPEGQQSAGLINGGQVVINIGQVGSKAGVNTRQTAGGANHEEHEQEGAQHHDDALDSIGDDHCAEAAEGGIDNYHCGKDQQGGPVGQTGDRLHQGGAAGELGDHLSDEEGHHQKAGDNDQTVRLIASLQIAGDGDSTGSAGDDGQPVAQHTHHQEHRAELHGRHPHLGIAIGHASSARAGNKGADGCVCSHGGHSQNQAVHATGANEVLLLLAHGAGALLALGHDHADCHVQNEVTDHDAKNNNLTRCHDLNYPLFYSSAASSS